ncbi:DEAD/DEAH box helicase family protein [Methanomethylophilus alvi]|uniref:DEAD/DEAH box helicase family protein n=1 Tax=Methanomethylophilus alvi TaxID=1291540 RepID=UPI0037DC19A4
MIRTIKGTDVPINQVDTVNVYGKDQQFYLDKPCERNSNTIVIYFYRLPRMLEHGIKVGMATCHPGQTFWSAIKNRIDAQVNELALDPAEYSNVGEEREVIHWGVALDAHNERFKDYYIHDAIAKAIPGKFVKDQEWFLNVSPAKIVSIFEEARKPIIKEIYTPRNEQRECIEQLKAYFKEHATGGRFLMNCKMRFGKCYTTYKFCEEANLNKILILTFVPAVEESWRDDLNHIKKDYSYYTDYDLRKDSFDLKKADGAFVLFLSLQNYLGKDFESKGVKEKIEKLRSIKFDLVVLDEYHFGAWNYRTRSTINDSEKLEDFDDEYQKSVGKLTNGYQIVDKFKIDTDRTVCLSGTPFKAIAKGEFRGDNSYTYSYFQEQKNKYPYEDSPREINPDYAHFPDMKIYGYNLSGLFHGTAFYHRDALLKRDFFSLNEFFAVESDYNYTRSAKFVHEEDVLAWIDALKGRMPTFKSPYINQAIRDSLKDSLWLMPSVGSCVAMAKVLQEDDYFGRYEIINLSDPNVGSGVDAFDFLMNKLNGYPGNQKIGSIAITVNKLTLGVTVKQWGSVFVLKDLASPEQYFQSIFRIQTPLVENGVVKKKAAYVFDFNIDRAAALLLKYAEQSESDGYHEKLKIARLIVRYLPIYVNGDTSQPIAEDVFFQLASFGDSSGESLSKRIADTRRTTRIMDEETIAEMLNDPSVSEIMKRVFSHAKFKKVNNPRAPAEPIPGFLKEEFKEGESDGYNTGFEHYADFVYLDDVTVQEELERFAKLQINKMVPKEYNESQATNYTNGFWKGLERGINAPVRKLNCGKDDGVKFVDTIRTRFGKDIHYVPDTKRDIDNFTKKYLNEMDNIPAEFRGAIYRRWYTDSFIRAVRNELKPKMKPEKGESVEDADNVLQHILARLFEFLYISVYRETTFREIFANADPNMFLAAVGITKEDFEVLNKYHIFQEQTLDNYIKDFFVNENLGKNLDLDDPNVKRNYRNSFNWFGYGVDE